MCYNHKIQEMSNINFDSDDEQTGARVGRRTWRQFVFRSGQYKDKSMPEVLETGAGRAYLRFLQSNSKGQFPHIDACIVEALAFYQQEKQRAIDSGAFRPPSQVVEEAATAASKPKSSIPTPPPDAEASCISTPPTDIEDCVVDYSPTPPSNDDQNDTYSQAVDAHLPTYTWKPNLGSPSSLRPKFTMDQTSQIKRFKRADLIQ